LLRTGVLGGCRLAQLYSYIQLHEYEALLFSDVKVMDSGLSLFDGYSRLTQLQPIRDQFESPEHIDEGTATAPSKRIAAIFRSYDKVPFGLLIASGTHINGPYPALSHNDQSPALSSHEPIGEITATPEAEEFDSAIDWCVIRKSAAQEVLQ
jgi:hypothetical protein